VNPKSDAAQTWLLKKLEERLAAVFEAMAGERPVIRQEALPSAPEGTGPLWCQSFQGLPGSLWIAATEAAQTEAARQVLHAGGLDDADQATLRSTFVETLGQALSGIAQEFSSRHSREVTCAPPAEVPPPSAPLCWVNFVLAFPNAEVALAVACEDQLLEALAEEEPAHTTTAIAAAAPAGGSKTFDLLLDVELPVSVSFGRAQVALKDVIKLTTGSIVELNRSIAEPVEVIVNNCVIARGEVVVVEGNFGVRIQQVISRQERLRTLN
jgi:flagellar motor switch protein FliN/FliY